MKTLRNKMIKNRRQSRRLLEDRKFKTVILRPNKIWDATMDFLTDKISYQDFRKILESEVKNKAKEKLNGNTNN